MEIQALPGYQWICEARGFGSERKLVAYIPWEYNETLIAAFHEGGPALSVWQMESSAIEYAQPEWQGFTSPASIGDKVWIISSRPKPGHIPEWDSKRPHHFGKRAEAEKEMDWLDEHHPLDNYLIACVTVGWVAPKVLKNQAGHHHGSLSAAATKTNPGSHATMTKPPKQCIKHLSIGE